MDKHIDYGTLIVRCNWCEHIYPEEDVKCYDGTEICEDCGSTGKLMDLGLFGESDDKVLFPELHKCRDWDQIKQHCRLEVLCYFENEIFDYNWSRGVYSEHCDDYPSIIQWWEGVMDTSELLERYGEI